MKLLKFAVFVILQLIITNCNNAIKKNNHNNQNNNHETKNLNFIYTTFGDSIIRYYPDKAIPDSLAVIEGLKTTAFGIAISQSKPVMYIFLNDSTWFTKDLSINKHIHLFSEKSINPDLKKVLISKKSKTVTFNECDFKYTTYYFDSDTLEYFSDTQKKFLDYAVISSKELGLFDLFEIGMSKSEFFKKLGFNDIPINGTVTIIITDPFRHMNDYESTWYNNYLAKIMTGRNYYGKNEIEYKLIFKNKKLQRIITF